MSHHCSSALVRCIDFRLGTVIRDYLNEKKLYGDVDIISVAGAGKDIAQSDESFPEGQIDLSKKLHHIKTVILMHHTDCGAYGGREAFVSKEEEHAQHVGDMKNARDKLVAKYPELKVHMVLIHLEEDETTYIEEIEE